MSPAESVPWDVSTPHGEIRRLRYVARFAYGDSLATDSRVDGDIAVMGSNGEVGCHVAANTLGPVVVIGRKGSFGKVTYSERPCFCIDTTYFVDARFTNADLRWLFYALQDLGLDTVSQDTGVPGLSRESAYDSRLLVPSSAMQRAIAAFLDRRTAAIDALIAKKERQIELLAEKRQALITQAVTKGLDPNVPMKDSGIRWLGDIPAHWEVHQLRRVVREFVDYRGRTPTKVDDGVPLITAGAVRDGRIDHARAPEYMAAEEYTEFMRRGLPELGDLVFTSEAPLGEVALVEDPSVAFAQRIILFRVNRTRMLSEFLWLYYRSDAGRAEVMSRASGSTAEGIRADRLRGSLVLVPPVTEQHEIIETVKKRLEHLGPISMAVATQIDRLREYRQALISAAVTGKIEIPAEEAA